MGRNSKSTKALDLKPARRGRTFTGCYNCRARKVKCNEAIPECGPCQKRGIACSGYKSKLVWMTSDQKSYKPNGRRFLNCESTWDKTSVLSPGELDYFVSLCDAAQYVKDFTVHWPDSRIPFAAFPSKDRYLNSMLTPCKLSRSLLYGTPLSDNEAFLFQHYANHVAQIMMPYEDPRNPWISSYPSVALYYMSLNQRSLYMALLAQAAFNLAHLGCQRDKMFTLATKFYTLAMEELRNNFVEQQRDYGTFVACVMTLMFVEIYSGSSSTWRAHFHGAWKFLIAQQEFLPWTTSIFAESSTQSLCIIKIVSDTSSPVDELGSFEYDAALDQERLVTSISSSSLFGFTIGATGTLMNCIADIRRLAHELQAGISEQSVDDGAYDILVRLDQCRDMSINKIFSKSDSDASKNGKMALYHLNAFIAATYIYLYETLFDLPPSHIKEYVAEVFHNIQAFFALGDGNFSLWPAFIAATAAYEPDDVAAAKTWLRNASQVGIGNRVKIQTVIEEVWRVRETSSVITGQDVGKIKVDWREVMKKLGFDILLV